MNEKIYFRTLCTPAHFSEWRSKNFNSYHHASPSLWVDLYHNCGYREESCFPLRFFMDGGKEVEYTEKARTEFLSCAAEHGNSIWPSDCLKKSSELNGICAFDNPKDVYNYGSESDFAKHGLDVYVVFKGVEICSDPENNGYVVKVLEIIHNEMRSGDFKALYLSDVAPP